jgi:hypothetical protein
MMNFWKKFGHLYDKIDYRPEQRISFLTTTGLAVARRSI